MRTHGTLIQWNEERGCGLVRLAHRETEAEVRRAAFPADGVPPRVGELISFDLEHDAQGRPRAMRVMRPGRAPVSAAPAATAPRRRRDRWLGVLALLVVLAVAGYAVLRFVAAPPVDPAAPAAPIASVVTAPASPAPAFQCDGRTHCAQMTSCAEAVYFLQHCPGVEMDGNHDGVPCERQWCRRAR
ncbi:excalibur calcium-binding domain-containing protein [Xanthomonas sp. A2111]|uniref:Excalibur calcium-binding domain-containing protein n=1 Tax=Xanthomonas hawaiiensis TaxID=3003247 RepID=A0ABU2I4D9_9XANT|nr:excalibur calcium-binding domain-containing protein [Xanthomonas sp. A2111]MBO9828243.1 excalibur calcium-binding domain-containing protein [Xanthomonas sp. A2111]MDS9992991.1 excalibur calcium-binding domain-containing protein [Xanthomonas sp. A2111]